MSTVMTNREQMTLFAETFHALRGAPGVSPWDHERFAKWASGGISTAEKQTAAFVLTVWSGHAPAEGDWWNKRPYRVPRFDAVRAIALWDHEHQAAFLAWCANPFWP